MRSTDSKFKIVAICNSSVESAAKSAKDLGLVEGVRVYGNVQDGKMAVADPLLDIANDKDVDLVVCTTRVDRHYTSILPSLKAGKDVFVEWPLGKNLEEARELLNMAKRNKVELAAVGLQGRFDAIVETLKSVLAEGRIGKVLSTTVTGQGMIGGPTELETQTYLTDRQIGATLLTIPTLHLLDTVWEVIKIVSTDGTIIKEKIEKTSPDHVMIQGTLESGAVLSATVRGGAPFKGSPGLEWNIYGEKGEIRIRGANAYIGIVGTTSVELHNFDTDEVETIELEKGTFAEMGPMNRNVARIYEAIAAGDKTILCDFEKAVKRHEFIEDTYNQNNLI
ncbi:hypothetical protein CJF31_00007040 [Rutstroemia sp. NJR-2017a BVV2]|nr:hypothetical protein CJF31_00007025 [Rutstroemia sp. NJR-2017a BVV2]PQE23278.1 hypothetical protein CJF31_00007040 [Rutstroemia sp. NJR-2017a BVV2]